MQQKKILHITYDMRIGGTETVIKNIVTGLDNQHFSNEILCLEPKLGPFGEQLKEQGVKITNLNWQGGFDLSLISAIKSYIHTNGVDVLHCHQYTPWVYGVLGALGTKAKVIFTEHGRFYPDRSHWKRRFINPLLLLRTSAVTAISKATKQALVDFEFIPERRIDVIYNGIAPLEVDPIEVDTLRSNLGFNDEDIILGTVARLDPIKNQTMMLEAFADVLKEKPNCRLLIVGDGEMRQQLEVLTDFLGIRERVIFTGYQAKPAPYLALMDVFLLSSFSEGTSMTLLEAMSLGIPSVVTDVGGNKEVISDPMLGEVSQSMSKQSFSSCIRNCLDVVENKVSGRLRYEYFTTNFSFEKMNREYSEIFE